MSACTCGPSSPARFMLGARAAAWVLTLAASTSQRLWAACRPARTPDRSQLRTACGGTPSSRAAAPVLMYVAGICKDFAFSPCASLPYRAMLADDLQTDLLPAQASR